MTIDELVRQTFREWAEQARVPSGDLAGSALRRRRWARTRTFAVAAGAAASVVVAAVTVPALVRGEEPRDDRRGGTVVVAEPDPSTETAADPDSSPPETLVAAGRAAAYSYYTWAEEKISEDRQVRKMTWHRYDRELGRYEPTPWAWLDVARGGRAAAFLETVPASRVGVLTGRGTEVHWITLDRPAASVYWSPDATRLLLTNYSANPDESYVVEEGTQQTSAPSRIGFTVVELAEGRSTFQGLPHHPDEMGTRSDLSWADDGTLVWEHSSSGSPMKRYYDLRGNAQAAPSEEADTYQQAGLSPGGRRLAVDGPDRSAIVGVRDLTTGSTVPFNAAPGYWIEQAVAWADDERLIVWACERKGENDCVGGEFRNRLLLVGLNGGEAVPLSGYRENNQVADKTWEPDFTTR
ncbi:hypothetical protein ACIBCT_19870 [Streptosporangium sp. NPDC050855]|uniref:hypothetical protein n=1 Tax=Streptosporangium sp. NPDC050855 TaxID=3366194 RepID=UPI00378E38DD